MHRTGSFNLVNRTLELDNKQKYPKLRGSVGSDLQGLEQDRAIKTDPGEARRRRTIKLHRTKGQTWGFTLQTYGIRNKRTREVEIMSYVDYVEVDGSAWMAGMRRGDIILSVNGDSVEFCTHKDLVRKIQSCNWELRLVVLFEDCCQKVELHERYLKLKRLLSQKMKELRELEAEEKKISQGIPLSRCDSFRQSTYSSTSSDWDIYSEITSPALFDCVPVNRFAFRDNRSQSVSDISTESSVDSLGSVSGFVPRGEDDCLFLKSSPIMDGESKTAGSKFRATKDSFPRSTLADDSSLSSSKIPEEDNIIPESNLEEHKDVTWFIEDDDRLSSFIQNNDSRFSSVELDDNTVENQHLQCSLEQEDHGFSQEEILIEGQQGCMICGCVQMDNNEEQHELGCRHTFHGPADVSSAVQGCDDLPEMSDCLNVCHTPTQLTPASSHVTDTSCRHEEDSNLVSVAGLQAGHISSPILAALPDLSDVSETDPIFSHQELTSLGQSEVEDYAQFEQDRVSVMRLTCGLTASSHTETSSCGSTTVTRTDASSGLVCPDMGLSLDATFCDACLHDVVNCACSNTRCEDTRDSDTKCQDMSDTCQDISDSDTKCQDISDTRCQDISDNTTRCQDISDIKNQDISDIKSQDTSDTKCQDTSDSNTRFQDISNGNTRCQDISDSKIKCQDVSECQDSMNITKYPDSNVQDSCRKCLEHRCQDSDSTCLEAAARCNAGSDHSFQRQQTGADYSGSETPSVSMLSEFFSPSSDAPCTTQDQESVNSKKRLINGVLVNDRNYSTRL